MSNGLSFTSTKSPSFILNEGDFVEVKDSPYDTEYHLIEFYGVFKNIKAEERTEWLRRHGIKFDNVLRGLVDRLNEDLTEQLVVKDTR